MWDNQVDLLNDLWEARAERDRLQNDLAEARHEYGKLSEKYRRAVRGD